MTSNHECPPASGPTILPLEMLHIRAISIFVHRRKSVGGARPNSSRLRLTRTTKKYPCVVQGIGLTHRQFERLCYGGEVVVENFIVSSWGAQWDFALLKPYIKLISTKCRQVWPQSKGQAKCRGGRKLR